MNQRLNRRAMLRWSMLAGAGGLLAACTTPANNGSSYAGSSQVATISASDTDAATSTETLVPEITSAATQFLAALDDK